MIVRSSSKETILMNLLKRVILIITLVLAPITICHAVDKEVTCLAKNIYHEARGESLKGQVAVALVTLNRTKHENYPGTVCGVVYDKGQFSWTSAPTRIVNNTAWKSSIELAEAVLEGNITLPNFNALYFHNVSIRPKWKTQVRPLRIGNHVFF
jgi:N-acetylmuramoyl-L-alanine amidase